MAEIWDKVDEHEAREQKDRRADREFKWQIERWAKKVAAINAAAKDKNKTNGNTNRNTDDK